jgi:hypothetical protein
MERQYEVWSMDGRTRVTEDVVKAGAVPDGDYEFRLVQEEARARCGYTGPSRAMGAEATGAGATGAAATGAEGGGAGEREGAGGGGGDSGGGHWADEDIREL